jgi:hypothetical protein
MTCTFHTSVACNDQQRLYRIVQPRETYRFPLTVRVLVRLLHRPLSVTVCERPSSINGDADRVVWDVGHGDSALRPVLTTELRATVSMCLQRPEQMVT